MTMPACRSRRTARVGGWVGRVAAREGGCGGMKQKGGRARALVDWPVLVLGDEPTTGLDARSRVAVQEFVR